MADKLQVYISSVSPNMQIKTRQQKIMGILEGRKITFEAVDIAVSNDAKEKMRALCGDGKALPPQLARGDLYIGNFDAFDDAVESETLVEFLRG